MDNSARARGFTLIEVIITVAIVAILAAVALPTYRDHMRKSRRAEAQAYLMAVASRQQQFLLCDFRQQRRTEAQRDSPVDLRIRSARGDPREAALAEILAQVVAKALDVRFGRRVALQQSARVLLVARHAYRRRRAEESIGWRTDRRAHQGSQPSARNR